MTEVESQAEPAPPEAEPVLSTTRFGNERVKALAATGSAFLYSRLFVFAIAIFAFLTFQPSRAPDTLKFDAPQLTHPFNGFADIVLGVWSRWDSVWYLGIAGGGYHGNDYQPAFFPLYPLLTWIVGFVFGGFATTPAGLYAGALLISLLAFAAALYLLHRLTALELGERYAKPTLMLVAFFPMAIFFSTIYSESLFLFTSIAAIYAGRRGSWAAAGAFGALAAATRFTGVLLIVPLAILYLWGSRADRSAPPAPAAGGSLAQRLRPKYEARPDVLWLLLVPAGLAAYMAYLWIDLGDPLIFSEAQRFWLRDLSPFGPLAGIYEGTSAAFQGVRQLVHGAREPVYWTASASDPFRVAALNIELFLFMVAALAATVGVVRRLPFAYGAYAIAALALPLSDPVRTIPLMSLPRFIAVIFPLFMWLALFTERRRITIQVVAVFAVGLGLFTAQWATWQWVS